MPIRLTPREYGVYQLLAKGQSQRAIAEGLGITYQTARGYVKTLYKKLGAHKNTDIMIQHADVLEYRAVRKAKLTPEDKILRRKCYSLYKQAMKIGFLVPATACSVDSCQGIDIEGHHADYHKPLDVEWLCLKHHRARHRGH